MSKNKEDVDDGNNNNNIINIDDDGKQNQNTLDFVTQQVTNT